MLKTCSNKVKRLSRFVIDNEIYIHILSVFIIDSILRIIISEMITKMVITMYENIINANFKGANFKFKNLK